MFLIDDRCSACCAVAARTCPTSTACRGRVWCGRRSSQCPSCECSAQTLPTHFSQTALLTTILVAERKADGGDKNSISKWTSRNLLNYRPLPKSDKRTPCAVSSPSRTLDNVICRSISIPGIPFPKWYSAASHCHGVSPESQVGGEPQRSAGGQPHQNESNGLSRYRGYRRP
jgi:hypothetical protein